MIATDFRRHALAGAVLLLLVGSSSAMGAVLRGRLIDHFGNPTGAIAVTTYHPQLGRSVPSFSGPDGMYYLNVPAGVYTLEIWVPGRPPMAFQIVVNEPNTDIAPITTR